MAWHAELRTETFHGNDNAPRSARRRLRLNAPAATGADAVDVLIHNLSMTGVLVEVDADIAVGESIEVDVPEAGPTAARVMWKSGDFHGCEFERPISAAAVSAAQLRSPAEQPGLVALPDTHESPEGLHPAAKASIIVGVSLALWGAVLLAAGLI